MKQIFCTLSLCLLFAAGVFSKPITEETALKAAVSVLNAHSEFRSASSDFTLVYTSPAGKYYVFNRGGNGFVIISADDAYEPVIAYSTTGNFDMDNHSPAFLWWMENVENQITEAAAANAPADEIKTAWKNLLNGGETALRAAQATTVGPLLATTWNQNSPYNNLCPVISGNNRYPTGCVATAMAQIMNYHKWPTTGQGSMAAYITKTNKISIPAIDFSQTTFQWSKMLNSYTSSSSDDSKNAVATLMYNCAVSVMMDFTAGGSASNNIDAGLSMVKYFGYDASLQVYFADDYKFSDWEAIVQQEINASRPVLFGGSSSTGGHSFVCDGYNNQYHINWGWGGVDDGWFALNSMKGYNSDNYIIAGIKKNAGGTAQPNMLVIKQLPLSCVASNDGKSLTVGSSFANIGLGTFNGTVAIILSGINNDNVLAYTAASGTIDGLTLDGEQVSYSYAPLEGVSINIPTTLANGDYRVRPAYKLTGASSYTFMKGQPGVIVQWNVTVQNGKVVNVLNGINSVEASVPALQVRYSGKNVILDGLDANERISLYDINGRMLQTLDSQGESAIISIDGMRAGVYIIATDKGKSAKFVAR
ncbi:MAG: C10 family peptidase [Dysgonamonadaceae bacterium]|jgi:hypothetical protein|nr:C10 family peptidase [Dysgonamonadaceae bacterium]